MGFDFNPTLWFVCRLCRHSFTSTESLKEHKLAFHLGECLQIKCIVFEETLLDKDWMPENIKEENRSSLKPGGNQPLVDSNSTWESDLKNPYVPLTRITEKEVKSTLINKNSCNHEAQGEKLHRRRKLRQTTSSLSDSRAIDKEFEWSQQEPHSADPRRNNCGFTTSDSDCNELEASSLEDDTLSEKEIKFKEEFPTNDNDVSTDVNDQEFIVASVSSNSDGVPRIQLSSANLTSASAHKDHFFQQRNLTTLTTSNTCPDSIEQSEHQRLLFNNEVNDLNSNSTFVQIQMDSYDSDASDATSAIPMQEQDPLAGGSGSTEFQQSDFSLNVQVTNATGGTVDAEKPFMCETCFAFFRTKDTLYKHMVCHSSTKRFKCSKCPSEFKRKHDLTRHQIVHGAETKYKCRYCNKSFGDSKNLIVHERTHTGDRPFKCPVDHCAYAGSTRTVLGRHIRTVHNKELGLQQFVCPTCGKTYGVRSYLDEHIRSHHGDTMSFHCTHQGCSKKFKVKRHLYSHRKTHQ